MDNNPSPMSASSEPWSGPRRTIATFSSYAEAAALVDRLADTWFDVSRVAIVGRDLRTVEQVIGHLSGWRTALGGAGSGALLGLLSSLLFGVWFAADGSSLLTIVLYWTVVTALAGAGLSLLGYLSSRGRRNFTSVEMTTAGAYDVITDEQVADEALRILGQQPARRAIEAN